MSNNDDLIYASTLSQVGTSVSRQSSAEDKWQPKKASESKSRKNTDFNSSTPNTAEQLELPHDSVPSAPRKFRF